MPNEDEKKRKGIYYLRPSVRWYAQRMEKRLREKDKERGKDGWHNRRLYYYLKKISECTVIILKIIRGKENKEIHEQAIHLAIKKCIDGGNFLMMLDDNLRDELTRRELIEREKKGGE